MPWCLVSEVLGNTGRSTPEKRPVVIGFVHPVDRTRETLRRNDLALVRKKEWRRGSRVVPGEIKLQKLASWFLLGEFRTLIPTRESQSSLNPWILLWHTAVVRHFRTRYVCFSVSMSVSVWYYRSSSVCLNVSVTVSVMLQIIIRVSVMLQIIISVTECQCQCDVTDHHQCDWMSLSVWCYRSSSVWLNVSVNVSVSVMLEILISMTECQCQCNVTDHHQSDWMSVSMSVSGWCYRSSSIWLNVSANVSVMAMLQIIISLTECHCQCQCQCDVTDHHQSDWMSVPMSVSMWCHRSLSVLLSISDSVMLQIIISLTECQCQCQCQCDVTDPHQSHWILSQSYRPAMFSVPCCYLHPSHVSVSCPF